MAAAKMKIAVDICNTLVDINSEIEKMGYRRTPGVYFFNNLPSKLFKEHLEIFERAKPFYGAEDALWRLSEVYDIVYLTARPIEAAEVTKKSLFEINNFPPGKIVHSYCKVQDFKKEGCIFAIDDSPEEISEYVKSGIRCYIHHRDYNTRFAGPRIIDWSGVAKECEREVASYA